MADNKKIQMINVFVYAVLFACFVHIGLSIQSSKGTFYFDSDINYINCSPSNLCYSCFNEFLCNQCAPSAKCCPKYCTTCKNTTYCNTCEKGFSLTNIDGRDDWRVCYNKNAQIDRNRQFYNTTKCKEGFYLDAILKFCQKCLIPYCKTCHQKAMNCLQCQEGYHFSGDICVINQVQPTLILNPISTNQQQQGTIYVLMILVGMIMGFLIACFITQKYICTKKECKSFCNSLSDQQKQLLLKVHVQQKNQKKQIESDQIVIKNKQSVITEAKKTQ